MLVVASARRHGIPDADMEHAIRHYVRVVAGADDLPLFIGPARNGQMLEVGVSGANGLNPRIVHAMTARRKFWP